MDKLISLLGPQSAASYAAYALSLWYIAKLTKAVRRVLPLMRQYDERLCRLEAIEGIDSKGRRFNDRR